MRNRFWNEMAEAKHNEIYATLLAGSYRYWLNIVNIFITTFSAAGVMGWKFWDNAPVVACIIIAGISLLKLVFPFFIPSEKQIEKLDNVSDFYLNFYLQLEPIWFDFENDRITEEQLQKKFYEIKQSEREINKEINKIHWKSKKGITKKTKIEADIFFKNNFNTIYHEQKECKS